MMKPNYVPPVIEIISISSEPLLVKVSGTIDGEIGSNKWNTKPWKNENFPWQEESTFKQNRPD